MKSTLFFMVCGIALAGCQSDMNSTPADPPADTVSTSSNSSYDQPATQPDNTGVNSRDRSSPAVTAGSQGQGKEDVQCTADIRRGIMKAHLSFTAQNVKVITTNGKVTLRGPVNTQDEKDTIGQIAVQCAGADNVDNQLDVKSDH